MNSKKVFALLICMLIQVSDSIADSVFEIIPKPQQMVIHDDEKGLDVNEIRFIVCEDCTMPTLPPLLDRLRRQSGDGQKGIRLLISQEDVPDNEEGYSLTVDRNGITVKAKTETGLFYGCQTVQQLMEDGFESNRPVPSMSVMDYPSISYRAVHLDTKHHLDRIEYYYRMMDRLARYKINGVIWEIEDKLRFERHPEVGAANAISKQEMQAISRYAKERHIDLSPLVQGLGHASFILKHHPELRENPQSDWEFCPSNPQTYEFLYHQYQDALEAMPYGRFLHVGGDEITAIGIDERCKATGKSAFELQMYWLRNVCDFARNHRRTPIFWDDMPLKYGGVWNIARGNDSEGEVARKWNLSRLDEAVGLFPKDCIYMRWNYGDATMPGHRKVLEWYKSKGLRVMGATAAAAGDSPFMPRAEKPKNIRGFSRLIADNRLEGILATSWDDGSPHLETVWRNFIAQGEFGWNPTGRTVAEFKQAHAQREFGLAKECMEFLDLLEKSAFYFDNALVDAGRRNPAWGTSDFRLIELPSISEHGAWSKKYAVKIDSAKLNAVRYEKIMQIVKKALNQATRNRYTLEVYEQTAELFNYPVRLILALHQFDMAKGDKKRKLARQHVRHVVDSFTTMRTNLESVYSKTRMMDNPKGYLLDQNHHNHLAAKSNNSGWLYLYELPMTEKVREWLRKME
uniref:beta-N-acetylhexosaminidase n=1 Tax=Prevotella sp. GTC17262 TaxID=3236797 RepID=A0AB33JHT8_9BACT